MQAQPPDEAAFAWRAAFELADRVQHGGQPPAAPPTVMLRRGEVQHGSATFDCAQFYGMDVEYSSEFYVSGGLLFSAVGLAASAARNAAARNRAERMSRPQWRPHGPCTAVVTNQRLLTMANFQWTSYYLNAIVAINLDLTYRVLVLTFEGSTPLMLRGVWAPWVAVVMSWNTLHVPWPPGTVMPPPARPALPGPTSAQNALPAGPIAI